MNLHPTAIIDDSAVLGAGIQVGPYAYIGPKVVVGDGVRIDHAATIEGPTILGAHTRIFPHAAVGLDPQDLKYGGEETRLEIGERCQIREFASLHRGTAGGGGLTTVGADVLIMNGAHVGHDCRVGNKCIIAANSALGGHVVLGDNAIIGGVTGVHQFVRVGAHAMIAAGILLTQDVPPYGVVKGSQETLTGVNITGLKRRGFSREAIRTIREAMDLLFLKPSDETLALRLARAREHFTDQAEVAELLNFVASAGSNHRQRGFVPTG